MSVEELFESSIFKCAEYSRSNIFLSQSAKDLKFAISINEMFYLWAVDTEKEFAKKPLAQRQIVWQRGEHTEEAF